MHGHISHDRSLLMRFRLTPKDTSFYALFARSAEHLVEGSKELTRLLGVEHSEREAAAARMRDIEHAADESTHAIMRKVNSSFITPFDREDIYGLASHLDDCMDLMEAAADLIVLYRIGDLPDGIAAQVEVLVRMAELTAEAMPRLRSMHDLEEYWIEINRLENQADQIYRRLLAELFNDGKDAIDVLKLKEVVDELEAAADAFETVANTVESIAVKES
jgi:predicted phosphate transport protein (TIGR00153 family)